MAKKLSIAIPAFLLPNYKPTPGPPSDIPRELIVAAELIHGTRHNLHLKVSRPGTMDLNGLRDRFEKHADTQIIVSWLENANESPKRIGVLFWLCVAVLAEWEELPKRTATQHRELYKNIAASAATLRNLMNESGSEYVRGGGYGLQSIHLFDIFTDDERAALLKEPIMGSITGANGSLARTFTPLPKVDEIIQRVESAALRLSANGPIHTQPGKRGAIRGFFVRRLAELCRAHSPTPTAEVLAALTTVVLNEDTDRELVTKLLSQKSVLRDE